MLLQDYHYDEARGKRAAFSRQYLQRLCEHERMRLWVKITLRYLTWESATVSTIVPIYRNIFIISPRTCVEVQHID